ncbi:uncharacterized protein TNCV_2075681 [Trichonephila clavipes]|nr:uncharacterized protein TNCV_2075681 [Trichonephila clavipes]
MVSDGAEFTVGGIEKIFKEARNNTKVKHKKWEKYYNRRRREVNIKVNDWMLLETHPISSATKKVIAKFKPKFEGPYRVLRVQNNNLDIWKAGKRTTVNIDQVRIYHQRKSDERGMEVGNSEKAVDQIINRVVSKRIDLDLISHKVLGIVSLLNDGERCKPKEDHSRPEENGSRSPARTDRSRNTRVAKNRSRGTDDPAVKVQDEVETQDSKSARRRTEGQRVGGLYRFKSSLEMSTTK